MTEYLLIDLLKHDDKEVSNQAKNLIRLGFPANSVWEIRLSQVIKEE